MALRLPQAGSPDQPFRDVLVSHMPNAPESLPVLLIPGIADSPRLFQEQLPRLFRAGPVMVADHTRDASVGSLAARILAHAPPRFSLAGLSLGGYVALEIMRQAPERVSRLALLNASARPETAQGVERRKAAASTAERGGYEAVVEAAWSHVVHPQRVDDLALKQVFVTMRLAAGAATFVRQQHAIMTRPDSRPSLGAIQCPTWVLVGDADEITPREVAEEMAAGISGARLVVVPSCGHLSALEQPQRVGDALLEWLEA